MERIQHEVVVVGSGAGGATVARELARRGCDVAVVERGRRHRTIGDFWSCYGYYDMEELPGFVPAAVRKIPLKLPRSKEGVVLWRALMAGGTTVVSCGNAGRCMDRELAQLGVALDADFAEAEAEMGMAPIDPKLLSRGSRALQAASEALGLRMTPMPKFVDPRRCTKCGRCGYGCATGARWSALGYLDEAGERGARILYDTKVEAVRIERGRARGIRARGPRGVVEVEAGTVILAAGGLDTPVILQRSGIDEAGTGFFVDLMWTTYAVTDGLNLDHEPLMALVDLEFHHDRGFLLAPFINQHPGGRLMEGAPARALRPSRRLLGIMTKISDDANGKVFPDGTFSKPVTDRDWARLREGAAIARRILEKTGAAPVAQTRVQGAHPGGAAAIGTVIGTDLQTRVPGLYVCDTSALPAAAFPDASRLPPILTVVALAKRLARQLANETAAARETGPRSGVSMEA